tara:strand:- start:84 stop:404 length:321 start_codon:yes stop_codon:yes gene_type:complete
MLSGVDKLTQTCYNISINKGETILIHSLTLSMTKSVLVHCQPSYNSSLKELGLELVNYEYDAGEVTAIVDDVPYKQSGTYYQDPDEQLCEHYGIDYNQVNCIELAD